MLDTIETILDCPIAGFLTVSVVILDLLLVLLHSSYLGLSLAEPGVVPLLVTLGAGGGEGLALLLPGGSAPVSMASRSSAEYAGASRCRVLIGLVKLPGLI